MTTTHQEKLGAYTTHQRAKESPRETDKRALLTCASRLQLAFDDGGKDKAGYEAALRINQRLWTMFAVALTDPENALPGELKVTLLNLGRYIDRVSFRAISEFSPHLLKSLIEINRAIATGLAKDNAPAAAPMPAYAAMPGYAGTPAGAMPAAGSVATTA